MIAMGGRFESLITSYILEIKYYYMEYYYGVTYCCYKECYQSEMGVL